MQKEQSLDYWMSEVVLKHWNSGPAPRQETQRLIMAHLALAVSVVFISLWTRELIVHCIA